jgi:hypothetical protein
MAEKQKDEFQNKGDESKEAQSSRPKVESSKLKAQKPATSNELAPVEELAGHAGITSWELAGLMRAAGWAPGKQATKEEFGRALDRFRKRPQGGGRIW